jgi:hypothetical protein
MTEPVSTPLDDKILNLSFTVKEVNSILNILGSLPFVQAVGLINAIQAQCTPQFEALQAEEAKNEPETAA